MTVERQVAALDGLALVCISPVRLFRFSIWQWLATLAGRSLAPLWDRQQVTQAISLRYGYRPRDLTLQASQAASLSRSAGSQHHGQNKLRSADEELLRDNSIYPKTRP